MEKIFCANDITTSEPTSRLAANKNRGTRLRISFIQLSALQCHSFRHILSQGYKDKQKGIQYSESLAAGVESLFSSLFVK